MNSVAVKPFTWVLSVSAVLLVAAISYLYQDHVASVQGHRTALIERGDAILDSLAAGMRAQGRMARLRGDRLPILIEEAARIAGVKGIRLATQEDGTVVAFGDTAELDVAQTGQAIWRESALLQAIQVEFPQSESGGPPPWAGANASAVSAMSRGIYTVSIALDAAPVNEHVKYERLRLAISAAVAACAVGLAAGLLWLELRRLALQAELSVTREAAAEQRRLAQLGAGLAHETKNPLNLVRGLAQDIAATVSGPPGVQEKLSSIIDEVDRTVGHINSFLEISRPREATMAPVRLDALLEEIVTLLRPEARTKEIDLVASGEALDVMADRELLRRALLNLAINAMHACSSGGRVQLEAIRKDGDITLAVTDNGCGIAAEDLAHVTEPYFTRFEGGTGLGLSIVQSIARLHQVTLNIQSRPGAGTRVSLTGFRAVD